MNPGGSTGDPGGTYGPKTTRLPSAAVLRFFLNKLYNNQVSEKVIVEIT
jgi:hypothetical protein